MPRSATDGFVLSRRSIRYGRPRRQSEANGSSGPPEDSENAVRHRNHLDRLYLHGQAVHTIARRPHFRPAVPSLPLLHLRHPRLSCSLDLGLLLQRRLPLHSRPVFLESPYPRQVSACHCRACCDCVVELCHRLHFVGIAHAFGLGPADDDEAEDWRVVYFRCGNLVSPSFAGSIMSVQETAALIRFSIQLSCRKCHSTLLLNRHVNVPRLRSHM